jgi:hypothetical protein
VTKPLKAAMMEPPEERNEEEARENKATAAMRRQLEAMFNMKTVRADFDGNALRDLVKGRRLNLIIRNDEVCLEVQSCTWDTYSIIWEGMAEIINDYGAIDSVVRAMALYEGWSAQAQANDQDQAQDQAQEQSQNSDPYPSPVIIPLDIHVSFLRDMPSYPDF